jgi:hypothetical protein
LASGHSELVQAIELEDHFVNAKWKRRRFGSKEAVRRPANHFRFTPINGHHWTGLVGPFDARSGRDRIIINNPFEPARFVRGDAASSLRFVLAIVGFTDVAKYSEEDACCPDRDERMTA